MKTILFLFAAAAASFGLGSCGRSAPDNAPPSKSGAAGSSASAAPASQPSAGQSPAPAPPRQPYWTDELLHSEIRFHNPDYQGNAQFQIEGGEPVALALRGAKVRNLAFLEKTRKVQMLDLSEMPVSDIRPVKGLPLVELYLEDTMVQDLSPLRGMKLQKLYLSRAPVRELSALEGMSFDELNLVETQVADLSPLAGSSIRMLWLTGCPVENIAPLKNVPMESLTLHRTRVKDLSPLAGTALQRLHIGETPVEDLSPLKGMSLSRLVFTPANIKAGLDAARSLPVSEIGTRFEEGNRDLAPPEVFWQAFDAAKGKPQ